MKKYYYVFGFTSMLPVCVNFVGYKSRSEKALYFHKGGSIMTRYILFARTVYVVK